VLTGEAAPEAPPAQVPRTGRARSIPTGWIAVAVPTAAIAVLALFKLGSRSLWLDEGDTFTTASQHGRALWHWMLNDGGNMVAYYLGMHVTVTLFGTSEVVLRLPSALSAVATVPVCFFLLRRLFDVRAAFFGASFVAVSLPFVYWAQQARGYLLASFLVTASTLAFVVAVEERRRWAFVVWAALSLLAVYTILLTALVLLVQFLSLLLRKPREVPWRGVLCTGGAVGVLCVPAAAAAVIRGTAPVDWLGAPGPVLGSTMRYLYNFVASVRVTGTPSTFVSHDLFIATVVAWAVGLVAFVWALARSGRSVQAWGWGLLIGWLVVPIAVSYLVSQHLEPLIGDRYLLDVLPAASMLAGVACSRLRPFPVALVAGAAFLACRADVLAPSYSVNMENWRGTVSAVVGASRPGDCIAFFVADGYTPFDYYVEHLSGPHPPVPTPVLPTSSWASRTPHVLDPEAIPASRMPAVVASCPRLWLVRSHDLGRAPAPGVRAYRVLVYDDDATLTSEIDANYTPGPTMSFQGAFVQLFNRKANLTVFHRASAAAAPTALGPARAPQLGARSVNEERRGA
jgi:4-amino-4-deoxy-L-arabinose transferase-like glycosyltransferase